MRTRHYTLPEVTAMHDTAVNHYSPEQVAAVGANLGAIAAAAVAAASERARGTQEFVISPEIAPIVEELRDSLDVSYQAYEQLADALGTAPEDLADITELFDKQLARWLATGSLDYIREQQELSPELSFSLVTVPNQVVKRHNLDDAAHVFANGQGHWTAAYIYNLSFNLYSDEELSGTPVSEPHDTRPAVRFVLVPSQVTDALGDMDLLDQRTALAEFYDEQAAAHPGINLKIPSVLDSIAWWYTLRAQQREAAHDPDKQLDVTKRMETYVRHIDLPDKGYADGTNVIPDSSVYVGGQPHLYYTSVFASSFTRVAVG